MQEKVAPKRKTRAMSGGSEGGRRRKRAPPASGRHKNGVEQQRKMKLKKKIRGKRQMTSYSTTLETGGSH